MLPLLLWLALDWKAEFCGHSVPHQGTTYFTPDHIVIEVEVLPDKASPIRLASEQFHLRLNGKKQVLVSVAPGLVASSVKYGPTNDHLTMEGQAGPMIVGRPVPQSRFPGDPRPQRLPNPVPAQNEAEPRKTDAEAIVEASLPEGPTLGPTKGLVYFPYRGKMTSLKTIEILWEDRVLKLR
jgi:hypothetical protein